MLLLIKRYYRAWHYNITNMLWEFFTASSDMVSVVPFYMPLVRILVRIVYVFGKHYASYPQGYVQICITCGIYMVKYYDLDIEDAIEVTAGKHVLIYRHRLYGSYK